MSENQEPVVVDTKVSDAVLFANDAQASENPDSDESAGNDQDKVTLTKAEFEELKTAGKRLSDTQRKMHELAGELKAVKETISTQKPQQKEPLLSEELLKRYEETGDTADFVAYTRALKEETKAEIRAELNDPNVAKQRSLQEEMEAYKAAHPEEEVDELYALGAQKWSYADVVTLGKVKRAGGWEKYLKSLDNDDRPRIPGRPDTAKGNQSPNQRTAPGEVDPNFLLQKGRERYGFKQ